MMMKYSLYTGIAFAVLLSGCAGAGSEAALKFNGSGSGSHSDTPKCNDTGKVTGSGSIPTGDVVITLTDSAGKQLFQQTFQGDFKLAATTVSGASGSWSFSAQRQSHGVAGDPFSGNYAFYVNC